MSEETLASVLSDQPQLETEETTATEESSVASPEEAGEASDPKADAKQGEPETEEQRQQKSGYQRLKAQRERERLEKEFWKEEALKARQSQPKPEAVESDAPPSPPDIETFQGTIEEFKKEQQAYSKKLEAYITQKSQREAVAREAEQAAASFNERIAALPELDDMRKVVGEANLPANLIGLMQENAARLKNGPEVLREILLDPEEREQLLALHRAQDAHGIVSQLHAISRTLRIANKQPAPKQELKPKPEPPKALTGRATTKAFDPHDDTLSADEWMKKRNAQLSRRAE